MATNKYYTKPSRDIYVMITEEWSVSIVLLTDGSIRIWLEPPGNTALKTEGMVEITPTDFWLSEIVQKAHDQIQRLMLTAYSDDITHRRPEHEETCIKNCPVCTQDTEQKIVPYDPDDTVGNQVWECKECGEVVDHVETDATHA